MQKMGTERRQEIWAGRAAMAIRLVIILLMLISAAGYALFENPFSWAPRKELSGEGVLSLALGFASGMIFASILRTCAWNFSFSKSHIVGTTLLKLAFLAFLFGVIAHESALIWSALGTGLLLGTILEVVNWYDPTPPNGFYGGRGTGDSGGSGGDDGGGD